MRILQKGLFGKPRLLALAAMVLALFLPVAALCEVEPVAYLRDDTPHNGLIRVCLASLGTPRTLDVQLMAAYRVSGTEIALPAGADVKIAVHPSSGQLTLSCAGQHWKLEGNVTLLRSTKQAALRIDQTQSAGEYPADLVVSAVQDEDGYTLETIAYIQVEDYLYGVLAYAVGENAPIEALKAQAIIARTYAVCAMDKHTTRSYDVVDTGTDQVYRGTREDNVSIRTAVDATEGFVLKYDGNYVQTYFSYSNGGQTEAAENAWNSGAQPYLTVRDDPFELASESTATKTVTLEKDLLHGTVPPQLLQLLTQKAVDALAADGYAATAENTSLIWLENIKLHTPRYAAPSRLYTKADFSLMTETASTSGGRQVAQKTVTLDIFDELESLLDMSLQSNPSELWSVSATSAAFTLCAGRIGHGVGLSQCGAAEMSRQGYAYDYILGFYFPGCTNVRMLLEDKTLRELLNTSSATQSPEAATSEIVSATTIPPLTTPLPMPAEETAEPAATATPEPTPVATEAPTPEPTQPPVSEKQPAAAAYDPALEPDYYASVTANDYVNLRNGPATNQEILAVAFHGDVVRVLAVRGLWAHVEFNGLQAYALRSLLSDVFLLEEASSATQQATEEAAFVQPAIEENQQNDSLQAYVYARKGTVNFRELPSKTASVLMRLDTGTPVEVTGTVGEFSSVEYMGVHGYMMTEFLRFEEEPALSQATPKPVPTEAPTVAPTPAPTAVPVEPQSAGNCGPAPAASSQNTDGFRNARVTTNGGGLNLRESPYDNARVLLRIPQCAVVEAVELNGVWCRVRYNGITGYAKSSFLTFGENYAPEVLNTQMSIALPEYSMGPATVETPSGSLNLRALPCPYAAVLALVPKGETVEVYTAEDGWALVSYREYVGYVSLTYLRMQDGTELISGGSVGSLPAAKPAAATEADSAPAQVEDENPDLFISAGYEPAEGVTALVTATYTSFRQLPDGDTLDVFAEGTELPVLALGAEWCMVAWNNQTGYLPLVDVALSGL